MKKLIGLCLTAAALSPLMSQAQQAYVGASVGRAELKTRWDAGIAVFGNEDTNTGYKLYGGYQFNPTFGVEGGFARLGEVDTRLSGLIAHNEARAVYLAGTATAPLSQQFALFGKLGVAHHRVEGVVDETTNRAFAAVGVSYAFTPAVSGVVEYDHFGRVTDDDFRVKANLLSVGVRVAF